jgi:hypothetical protein
MGEELKLSSGELKKLTRFFSGKPMALRRPASLAQGALTPASGGTGPVGTVGEAGPVGPITTVPGPSGGFFPAQPERTKAKARPKSPSVLVIERIGRVGGFLAKARPAAGFWAIRLETLRFEAMGLKAIGFIGLRGEAIRLEARAF